tara:strand:+ start:26723 stop:28882 length:2160 start_codon:yes stop_codon:yes gene_type:complete
MGWRNKSVAPVGSSRVMADVPQSDGTYAFEIVNFDADPRGILDSTFRMMPLHAKEWGVDPAPAQPFYPVEFNNVYGMGYFDFGYSGKPEILFLTGNGVRRFTPWKRTVGPSGLEQVLSYQHDNTTAEVIPTGTPEFPAQFVTVSKNVYITFCDGSGAWVWDGVKLRKFGYSNEPPPPTVQGPSSGGGTPTALGFDAGPNGGGFALPGRIGSLETNWTNSSGVTVGGMDSGQYEYYVVWENEAGAYSGSSPVSSPVTLHQIPSAGTSYNLYRLTRSFWVSGIEQGPPGTVARIILRTPNLRRLALNDDGAPRFAKRIPNNVATEYVDDVPDGSLGPVWQERSSIPIDFYFIQSFAGSMFVMRTDEYGSRVWWSEQTNIFGPTPESFLKGHWMDVFSDTGAITGSATSRIGTGEDSGCLLVFKDSAVHAIVGTYPNFRSVTLKKGPGLAGPSLVQEAPDGTVIFYGANTFWRLDPNEGSIVDIGGPIRKKLSSINPNKSRYGVSWIKRKTGELFFALPEEDSSVNDIQFVYDYRYRGWRMREDAHIHYAITIPSQDFTLLYATYDSLKTVWVRDRGYSSFAVTQPTAKYSSGWFSLREGASAFSSTYHLTDMVVTAEERGSQSANAYVYEEWTADTKPSVGSATSSHAEEDNISYYSTAVWGTDSWRSRKFHQQRVPLDTHTTGVSRVEIQTNSPFCIYGIEVYGVTVATPSGRVPEASSS